MELAPVVETLRGRRVVALPEAIDAASWPGGAKVLRLAPDDVLVVGPGPIGINDPHAIVELDGGFCYLRTTEEHATSLIARAAFWQLPEERPCFAQGMVAGLPLKIWLTDGEAWLITPTPFAAELEGRFS